MRIQLYLLVLGEHGFRPFKYQLHDDLWEKLEREGKDHREYMRDRLKRRLRQAYGDDPPMYFFVLEDRDDRGNPVRPHAHGGNELKPYPVEEITDARVRRHCRRIERAHGDAIANREAGRWITRQAMVWAAGLKSNARVASTGVDQSRNVWWRKPTLPIFNQDWVTYCLKNVGEFSPVLGENRVARDYKLNGEAERLWKIIPGT